MGRKRGIEQLMFAVFAIKNTQLQEKENQKELLKIECIVAMHVDQKPIGTGMMYQYQQ